MRNYITRAHECIYLYHRLYITTNAAAAANILSCTYSVRISVTVTGLGETSIDTPLLNPRKTTECRSYHPIRRRQCRETGHLQATTNDNLVESETNVGNNVAVDVRCSKGFRDNATTDFTESQKPNLQPNRSQIPRLLDLICALHATIKAGVEQPGSC